MASPLKDKYLLSVQDQMKLKHVTESLQTVNAERSGGREGGGGRARPHAGAGGGGGIRSGPYLGGVLACGGLDT